MKKAISLLSFMIAFVLFTTINAQTRELDKTFSLNKDGVVEINNYKGSINIKTWDKSEVKIHVKIEADGWGRDQEKRVNATEIIFRDSQDKVSMKTDYPKNFFGFMSDGGSNPLVHYTITMPVTAQLEIDDYKSDIDIQTLNADILMETYKGSVNIDNLSGAIDLETYKGDAKISFKKLTKDNKFDTYKGRIEVFLPADTKFSIDADLGKRGDFDSDFELSNERSSRRRHDDDYVRGDVNGGGPYFEFSTYKGDFRLLKK